ncbi:MAG: hydrogenase maturation protease [Gammaproteobacteria bacterium]|nr:hydrogenase maturation protease [Gammaproteobacteria bacterium]
MTPSVLIVGVGNPSRGDDALGPLLIEQLETLWTQEQKGAPRGIELLTDFQLQIEHALDLLNRSLVLFVDAHVDCLAPFELTFIQSQTNRSVSTHALSPAAVLKVFEDLHQVISPPAFQLGLCAESFELGESLSPKARLHLEAALDEVLWLCQHPDPNAWKSRCRSVPPPHV